jgi:hypothetical protein
MPETDEASISVTLAEIARIAGVGRAAVSNWRRRHESFPAPIGGTDTSPQFSLSEVEQWLRENDKLKGSTGLHERLWPKFDALGDKDAMGRVIAALGLSVADRTAGSASSLQLDATEQSLLDESLAAAKREGTAEVFRFLLDRWLTAHVRQITTTPEPIGRLMAEVADEVGSDKVRTVLDPACGSGTLLLAAARRWKELRRITGQDKDAVLAALTAARLHVEQVTDDVSGRIEVTVADSLRHGTHAGAEADVILSSPPANVRDWGHDELATDTRWVFGLPPRSESELAWVQEVIASLALGGTGVLLLPPTVAARRAGRRIRAALLRAGALRAVIALPVGAAPPYGVGLHLWVVQRPVRRTPPTGLLLVDTGDCRTTTSLRRPEIDWDAVRDRVVSALRGQHGEGSRVVPVIELLDEGVDLSPARHTSGSNLHAAVDLGEEWSGFRAQLERVTELSRVLSELRPPTRDTVSVSVSVAELERAGAVSVRAGRPVPEDLLRRGERPDDGVPVLTVHDLLTGNEPEHWIPGAGLARADRIGLTVADPGDVVLIGAQRAFDAWVQSQTPVVLGTQLLVIRPRPSRIDPWFLAGSLRTSTNVRRAGRHASTSSRIDVRRLEVLRLPVEEQRRYGEVFREIAAFECSLRQLAGTGAVLRKALGELLAAGRLPTR